MELVEQFLSEHEALREVTPKWMRAKRDCIRTGLHYLEGDLEATNTEKVIATLGAIKRAKLSRNYIRNVFLHTRAFFVWMARTNPALDPVRYRAAAIPRAQLKTKTTSDLLTPEEMETVINACRTSRDRALLSMLYDGSNRPIEALSLTWQDLHFDNYGVWFTTSAKTGKGRRIRLTPFSVPYLSQWRQDYPGKPEGAAPLFVSKHFKGGHPVPMTMRHMNPLLQDLKVRTGLVKLKPSIFRPSKITQDVKDGLDPAYIALKNWGTLKTPMLDVYATPGGDYIDRVALESAGQAVTVERRAKVTAPPVCQSCGDLNPMAARYCGTCGRPLTEEAKTTLERMRQDILGNPEAFIKLLQKVK